MDRHHRLVATNKLSSTRKRTPYDRPGPQSRAGRTPNNAIAESASAGLVSKLKGMLTPSRLWGSSQQASGNQEEPILSESQNSITADRPSSPSVLNAHRINNIRVGTPDRINLLSEDSSSPNNKLIDFFRSKGDDQLTDIEREGVLALIQQASDKNQAVLDLTPKREDRVSLIKSQIPPSTQLPRTPLRLSASPQTPIRYSPVNSPKYSPFYSSPKTRGTPVSSPTASNNQGRSDIKKVRASASQHFSIPTPYRSKPSASTGNFHFALPTSASLGHAEQKKPSAQLESRPLSQTALILNSLLDNDKDQEMEEMQENAAPTSVYSLPRSPPLKKNEVSIKTQEESSPARQNGNIIEIGGETKRTPKLQSRTSPPSVSLGFSRKETLSSSLKKTPKFQSTPISHPYQPTKSSSLRQGITASPGKRTTPVTSPAVIKHQPFDFKFSTSTESAKKNAPSAVSPAKPLFGESPATTTGYESPYTASRSGPFQFTSIAAEKDSQKRNPADTTDGHGAAAQMRFTFPIIGQDTESSLNSADVEKLAAYRELYNF